MSEYLPKPSSHEENIKVKIDLTNYATKNNIKNITHVDTSSFALKTNLSSLKNEVEKLDINKLVPVPTDLSKLSNVVKNDVVKKIDYNKSVAKVDNIDTNGFVLKTKYSTDKAKLENEIPDTSDLVQKTDYNNKITEIEIKIPDISNLATKILVNKFENRIPDVSNLVKKKTDYNTKITNIDNKLNNHNHGKYIDTSKFNTLTTNVFNTRLAQANLITKIDFNAKLSNLNRKITQNKSKHLLIESELNKLKTFDSSYFIGKNHFEEDGVQNYLIFQPMYRYIKTDGSYYILSWSSEGLSNESIKPPSASNNFLTPSLNYSGTKLRVKFNGSCLKQDKVTYTHGKIVNIYIVHEINKKDNTVISDPTLGNCLFGAVTLTKNADIDKYGYSGYGIGFDRKRSFSFSSGGYGQNVIIFGVNMSSSIHIDNKKKDILILGRRPTQGLESTLTAEKCIQLILQKKLKSFV